MVNVYKGRHGSVPGEPCAKKPGRVGKALPGLSVFILNGNGLLLEKRDKSAEVRQEAVEQQDDPVKDAVAVDFAAVYADGAAAGIRAAVQLKA